jgi:RNA recognition motif-containing protein
MNPITQSGKFLVGIQPLWCSDHDNLADEINNVIFVGNLAWTTTNEDLKTFFSAAGKVINCEVKRFPDTYRSKGWGY